jgi:lactate dehydrogenase-like 2-hydroxyacid dehydrogenase
VAFDMFWEESTIKVEYNLLKNLLLKPHIAVLIDVSCEHIAKADANNIYIILNDITLLNCVT